MIWKDIPGYEGLYQISDEGKVKRLPHAFHSIRKDGCEYDTFLPERLLQVNSRGCVGLLTGDIFKDKRIDDLLALTFLGLSRGDYIHKDNDPNNMQIDNLVSCKGTANKVSDEDEVWKPIIINHIDYSGLYECSNKGRIRSKYRVVARGDSGMTLPSRILKLTPHTHARNHYLLASLCKDSKTKQYLVHRIVATLFVNNPDPIQKTMVNHLDSDKSNNCAENLEWVSNQENVDYAWSHGEISADTLKQNVEAMNNSNRSKWRKVICIESGSSFSSIEEASREACISSYLVQKSCETKQKVKGLTFSYV